MRLSPPLLAALVAPILLVPAPAVAGLPCVTPALVAPDARALSGDGYVRVAADGSASWLLPGVVGASWHGTRAAYWTEPPRGGLPSLLCVDGSVRHAGVRTQYAAFSPDGTRVAVGDAGTLTIVTGSVVTTAGGSTTFAWSPAGDALAVAHEGQVTVRALDGTVTATLDSDRYPTRIEWAGDRVVYSASSGDGETHEVVSVRADGTGRVALPSAQWAAFASSGSRIAYVTAAGDLRTVGVDGTAPADVPVAASRLAFSPDGTTLAYAGGSGGGTVAAAGTTPSPVVAGSAPGTGWADGVWFAHRPVPEGGTDVHTRGVTVARAEPGHEVSIVRRDADGSYVVAVAVLRSSALSRVG